MGGPSSGGGPLGMTPPSMGMNVMSDSSPMGGGPGGPRPMMGGPQSLMSGSDGMPGPPMSGPPQGGNFPMRMLGPPGGMGMRMPNTMRMIGPRGPLTMMSPMNHGNMGPPGPGGMGMMPDDMPPIMLPPGMKAGPDADKFIKDQKLVREKEQEARWKMLQQQRIAQRMAQQQQQQQQHMNPGQGPGGMFENSMPLGGMQQPITNINTGGTSPGGSMISLPASEAGDFLEIEYRLTPIV